MSTQPTIDATGGDAEVAYFALGWFWTPEPAFKRLRGVRATRVGYTGGQTDSPTYSKVCSGKTGHSEAVKVVFDSSTISYAELVDKFFSLHPYQYESKPQYMSALFYLNDAQRDIAQAKIDKLKAGGATVATKLLPATKWHDAEEYHQNYHAKNAKMW